MYRVLPRWYGELEKDLRSEITLLANKQNIQWRFIHDSKLIDESIRNIMQVMLRLKEEVRGELDEETLKEFKDFEEAIAKKEAKEAESKAKGKAESKVTRVKGNTGYKKRGRKTNKKI